MRAIIVSIILVLSLSCIGYSQYKVRAYGTFGYTGGQVWEGNNGSALNYRGGVQLGYTFIEFFSIGVDLAYLHAFTADGVSPSNTAEGSADYLHSLVFVEMGLGKNIFTAQLGFGPYFDINNYSTHRLGMMLAVGLDIPITRNISIPVLFRTDIIFGSEIAIPLTMMTGVTFRFGSRFLNW